MAEGQEALERWWEDITWRAQEVSLPTNMAEYAPPADNECWSKVQRVVDGINEFGRDPSFYMDWGREEEIKRQRD